MASCKAKSWLEVAVKIPPAMESPLNADLSRLVPSLLWREEKQMDGHCLLTAVVTMDIGIDRIISRIEGALQQIEQKHALRDSLPVELHVFEGEDPAGGWRQQLQPWQVSSRLLIGPPCERGRAPQDQTVLLIDPQEAFGDGNHPSTRLALQLLDELMRGQYGPLNMVEGWVLDAGCGSGVLALAATALSGFKALAVDLDPRAIDAARGNLGHNAGPGSKVSLVLGELSCARGPFCIVLANLVPPVHMRVYNTLWRALGSGGWLILSGFCQSQKDSILRPYIQYGASEKAFSVDTAWAGTLLHKPAG
jgi:ribosomal protein L11 methyltransferase